VHITPVAPDGTLLGSPAPGLQGSKGLGLEIENIAALPDAGDYSQHEFYLANFTASEIAYCTKEPKTKAAFQGLLAAKRAIVKSGAVSNPPEGHRSIEISFDGEGRPAHPGCLLSISHTETIAVAFVFGLASLPGRRRLPLPQPEGSRSPPNTEIFAQTRIFAFLVLLSLLALFALGLLESP